MVVEDGLPEGGPHNAPTAAAIGAGVARTTVDVSAAAPKPSATIAPPAAKPSSAPQPTGTGAGSCSIAPMASKEAEERQELRTLQQVLSAQEAACTPPVKLPWWTWAAVPFTGSLVKKPVPKTVGHAYVRILEASGLVPWEMHRVTGGAPSSNPFVEVSLGQHNVTSQCTRVIGRSLAPAWDEAFMMAVSCLHGLYQSKRSKLIAYLTRLRVSHV